MTSEPGSSGRDGYRLTQTAEVDLEELLGFVAECDGAERALRVHAKLERAFELLASHPGLGTTRPRITGAGVRWWAVSAWIVIYAPSTPGVTILRVIHGARECGRLLGPSGSEDREPGLP